MTLKLGSLFDGSGGFPLAGVLHGVEPVWASEIEPYPIKVTKARFLGMKHLGSVLDVNGADVEPVDIITFGSPCQDLSVAGKQAGLENGVRSNLFYEAIRIIKEMRSASDGLYPRVAIWENVPGAFSSNNGKDFQSVLKAFAQINDEAADVPRPSTGKWNPAGTIVGNGWSVAWRTFDAQYWGVPQRRKRIYLIADFGSERAGEILLEPESVRGHSAESGTAGEGAAGDAAGGVGRGVQCLNPFMPQTSRIYSADGVYPCLPANETGGLDRQAVCYPIDSHQQDSWFRVCEDGVCPTVPGQMGTGGNNGPMVLEVEPVVYAGVGVTSKLNVQNPQPGDPCPTLNNDSRNYLVRPAKPPRKYIIRRLTPLECCRLQGFPDDWCSDLGTQEPTEEEIHFWTEVWETHRRVMGVSGKPKSRRQIIKWLKDPYSDSAEYKMWGNGLALPNAAHVVGCAVRLIHEGRGNA